MDQSNYGLNVPERLESPLSQFKEAMQSLSRGLRVALPAQVVSFDATKQTVVVQPSLREFVRVAGALSAKSLPPLLDVPILMPRAGDFTLTMPVREGDECLVVFADTCIDTWFQSGGEQNQMNQRRHSLSDGFAILGPWNQTRVLPNYSANSAQLRSNDGATVIDLAAGQVTVTAQTVNVNASGNATVNAQGTATVQGATVNVTGSSSVRISGNGSTTIEGHDFLHHTHSGVAGGGSISGPVA